MGRTAKTRPLPWSRPPSRIGSHVHRPPTPLIRDVRILHIAQSIVGGVASFLEEVAPFQTQLYGADNVHFLIPAGSEAHLGAVDASQILTFAPTGRNPRALLQFRGSAQRAILKLQPDIVHLHSTFAGAAVRAAMPRHGGRPRIVYCAHGWAFGMEIARWKKRLYALIERALASCTDIVLCISQSEYDLAVAFGQQTQRMRVIRNGVAMMPLPRHKARSGPIRLGFIGRHDRQKGLDILLETIGRFGLGGIRFDLIGEAVLGGCGGADVGRFNNVIHHGWMPRSEIFAKLAEFDAVVMPSRWEAFGLVAIEAMRAGVPVIASNRGALPEIVEDGIGGLIFDLDDPDGLGELLKRLDRSALMKLGARARARFEAEYVSERMNELTCNAYDDAMSDGSIERVSHTAAHRPFSRRADCAVSS